MLTYEPDRRGNLLGLTPRVLINDADLAATGVIQPGSHAHYYVLFAGVMKDVMRFKSWLKPRLNPGEKLLDIREDRPEIGSAFKRAEKYLGLASVVVVMIAGVAIGVIEAVGAMVFAPAFKYGIIFLCYLIVVMIRPKGLFGRF